MLLLDKNQYDTVLGPLKKVSINHLFARSVAENHVTGKIYADNFKNPSSFYIVHPYGMSLLFGNGENEGFNHKLKMYMQNTEGIRDRVEWMQAYPGAWNSLIKNSLRNVLVEPGKRTHEKSIEVHTRANFSFNPAKYRSFKTTLKTVDLHVVRTDKELYEKMNGIVVPKYFWDNADDFCKKGVGFSLIVGNKTACTAYSAYIFENLLELGIETLPEHRGKGFALYTCSALIDYCIENNFEPVWSCRLENKPSYRLAQRLGFEPTVTLPYYRLPV
jgi:GNAT superfamily N-acetyltransferase